MKQNARAYRNVSTLGCYDYRDSRRINVRNPYDRKDIFSFFIKSKLKIVLDDPKNPGVNTFAPSLEIQPTQQDRVPIGERLTRRYPKVRIQNYGKELATNSEGE